MESSPMFYGHYSGTFVFRYDKLNFDFPLAYFLVMFSVFLLNLSVVVISSAKSAKSRIKRHIFEEDGRHGVFSIVFGSWAHKIR